MAKLIALKVRPTVATLVPAVAPSNGQDELERENSLLRSVLVEARGGLGDCGKQVAAILRAAARSRQGRDKCDRQEQRPDPK